MKSIAPHDIVKRANRTADQVCIMEIRLDGGLTGYNIPGRAAATNPGRLATSGIPAGPGAGTAEPFGAPASRWA